MEQDTTIDIGELASARYREQVEPAEYRGQVEVFLHQRETRREVAIMRARELLDQRVELTQKYGGKAFGILVLNALSESGDFEVPQFELIGTDLWKQLLKRLDLPKIIEEEKDRLQAKMDALTAETILGDDIFFEFCGDCDADARDFQFEGDTYRYTGEFNYSLRQSRRF